METKDLLKRVRKIEIKTRGLSNQIFSGEYHSAFKGRGMAFAEVREYQPGDEIRTIDWNVTARLNHPYVKVFEEERELTVVLLVDVSASGLFGSQEQLKKNVITELTAVLAFSAIQNNDKIGVIFFSDKIEKFIPPKKGRSHILRIISECINFKPESSKTDISGGLKYLSNVIKKKSIAFLLSDFMDDRFEDAIKIANKKHDLVAIQVSDIREKEMPNIGMVPFLNPETGTTKWIDTSSKKTRVQYKANGIKRQAQLDETLKKSGVDHVYLETHKSYVQPLMNLFKRREARR